MNSISYNENLIQSTKISQIVAISFRDFICFAQCHLLQTVIGSLKYLVILGPIDFTRNDIINDAGPVSYNDFRGRPFPV